MDEMAIRDEEFTFDARSDRLQRLRARRAQLNQQARRQQQRFRNFRGSMGARAWGVAPLAALFRTKQGAIPLTPRTNIVVINNSALSHNYEQFPDFKTAVQIACSGSASKGIGAAATAVATGLSIALALTADVFGCYASATANPGSPSSFFKVKVSASVTNFTFQTFRIDIGIARTDATPVITLAAADTVVSFAIEAQVPVAEVVCFSPSNGAGQFSLVPGIVGQGILASNASNGNTVALRSINSNTFGTIESLNMRDFLPRPRVGTIRDEDEAYDEIEA
jgi:hypothetical protein